MIMTKWTPAALDGIQPTVVWNGELETKIVHFIVIASFTFITSNQIKIEAQNSTNIEHYTKFRKMIY